MKDLKIAVGKLREEINALAKESRALADQRRVLKAQGPSTGPERSALWGKRKAIGWQARSAILASGLLRGRRYRSMEQRCERIPYAGAIALRLMQAHGLADENTKPWHESVSPFEKYVAAWLAEKPEGAELPEAAE